jgi:hypothetical protein
MRITPNLLHLVLRNKLFLKRFESRADPDWTDLMGFDVPVARPQNHPFLLKSPADRRKRLSWALISDFNDCYAA